jgi:2-keto-4-pentenoate hydratase/2-oxohepta-3-ene-1,7-dioic acid hydratase in catechol pathway
MTSRVNGVTWCDASSTEMIWSCEELVAWASASENLGAGTLLGSGTANGGSGIELGRKLQPGDSVELEIQGLGVLRNKIGSKSNGWLPEPRNPNKID